MNILYDHQIFSIQKYGGVSRYFCELIKGILQISDMEVYAYLGYYINKYGLKEFQSQFKLFRGRQYEEIKKTKMLVFELNNLLFKRFYNNHNFDIYHQTYYAPILKKSKSKRIVTVFDMTHELFPASFSKLDRTSAWKKEMLPLADGIICISESTKKDLLNYFDLNESKIKVIYLGNSLSPQALGVERIIKEPYILFVGDRRGYKNFKLLIEAFSVDGKINIDFKLVCFGGGEFSKSESEFISLKELNKKIIHIKGNDEELANLYKHAEAFVYPSKYEGFGIPLLEAMNQDCAVITSKVSSLPEVAGDAAEYIDPDNKDSLIHSLNKVLYDKKYKKNLVEKGRSQRQKFTWENCIVDTVNFYNQIN